MLIKRRYAMLTALFGAGYVGLRAMATGLPAWLIANPRSAKAADLACAITAKDNLQYLIVSVSSNGDPMSCNAPGTYENTAAIHPQQAEVARADLMLGGKIYGAALPWTTLDAATLSRTAFLHHVTLSIVHGDQPKVLRLMGATSGGEMIVSAYAKRLGPCFGTVQNQPVAVGAGNNASEMLSYSGSSLPSVSPTQLRQLLTGSGASGGYMSGGSTQSPLVKLRSLRDQELNKLYALAKSDGTQVQMAFLDALTNSQTQVRELANALSSTLSMIKDDSVTGQALAAAALISANVTPVVTMHIPFGGDNHNDSNLQAEADQTVSGVTGIQTLMSQLSSMGLSDKVTFATLNVFGRNLNGISKLTASSATGRDHFGDHSVAVMIGKNINAGVYGGIGTFSGSSNGALGATDIDSATGASAPGGDIPRLQSNVAMARTLGVALGIPASQLDADFNADAGGKIIAAAVKNAS
jgi:hypothetical protein